MKENQPTLRQEIATLWELESVPPAHTVQVSKHGGRLEVRRLWASAALEGYSDWPHVQQVCRLERIVTRSTITSREVAYAATSLPASRTGPRTLLALWRGHWGIENRVHWVRDVTFDEDRCQVRCGAAPQVLAAFRNLVIGLARRAGNANIAAALRRYATHTGEALALIMQ